MSFTPGPWEAENEYECAVYTYDRQMKIADIRGWGYLTGKGQGGMGLSSTEATKIQNANARLITAAPEMYELLKRLNETEDFFEMADVSKEIPELLHRIKGEEGPE